MQTLSEEERSRIEFEIKITRSVPLRESLIKLLAIHDRNQDAIALVRRICMHFSETGQTISPKGLLKEIDELT